MGDELGNIEGWDVTEVLQLIQKSKLSKLGYSKKKENSLNVTNEFNIESVTIIILPHHRSIPEDGV